MERTHVDVMTTKVHKQIKDLAATIRQYTVSQAEAWKCLHVTTRRAVELGVTNAVIVHAARYGQWDVTGRGRNDDKTLYVNLTSGGLYRGGLSAGVDDIMKLASYIASNELNAFKLIEHVEQTIDRHTMTTFYPVLRRILGQMFAGHNLGSRQIDKMAGTYARRLTRIGINATSVASDMDSVLIKLLLGEIEDPGETPETPSAA